MSELTYTFHTGESKAALKVIKCAISITKAKQVPALEKMIENFEILYGKESSGALHCHLLNVKSRFKHHQEWFVNGLES